VATSNIKKWMNFYTNVLSKFASDYRLEADASSGGRPGWRDFDAKGGRTKVALRELGLKDTLDEAGHRQYFPLQRVWFTQRHATAGQVGAHEQLKY